MTGDRVEVLREALDEAERLARAAFPGPWRYNPGKQWYTARDAGVRDLLAQMGVPGEEFVGAGPLDATVGVAATGPADDPQSMADAEFIAAWDPSRVLRLVERDRKLLGDLQQPWHCQTCAYGPEFAGTMHECPVDEFRLKTLRDLAVFWLGEEPGT